MRAAVLREVGGVPSVEDVTLPVPGPGQVRVRLAATGVCHSDLSLADGTMAAEFPVVLGHEGAGRVAEVGPEVSGLSVGDPVVLNWAPACRRCWYCERGEPYLCPDAMRAWQRPYATLSDGSGVYQGLGTAAFGAETVVDVQACVPLPKDIPLDQAALLGCAVLTGVGSVVNAARVQPGESVLIIGLGGVGLCAVQGAARIAGAGQVITVDPSPHKAELARRLGATETLEPSDDLASKVRGLTEGRGVDHAIECVGRAETIRGAWSATRRGGRTTVVGMGARGDKLAFNALEIAYWGRTLAGCMFGNSDPAADLPALIEHYRAGRLDLAALVTDRIGLDQIGSAFEAMRAGRGARSLVVFDDDEAWAAHRSQ
jgi:S-(hydroxymethyl)glutathione dehydrogenase/alcohol dehydrogenase